MNKFFKRKITEKLGTFFIYTLLKIMIRRIISDKYLFNKVIWLVKLLINK